MKTVINPAATMAMFAKASFRAERKGGVGQASAVMPIPRQHERTGEVDRKRARARQAQRYWRGWQREHEFLPCCPERGEAGNEKNDGEGHSHASAIARTPTQRDQYQKVD
jgi:hypothetical protein